jgi:hypothetical protein
LENYIKTRGIKPATSSFLKLVDVLDFILSDEKEYLSLDFNSVENRAFFNNEIKAKIRHKDYDLSTLNFGLAFDINDGSFNFTEVLENLFCISFGIKHNKRTFVCFSCKGERIQKRTNNAEIYESYRMAKG